METIGYSTRQRVRQRRRPYRRYQDGIRRSPCTTETGTTELNGTFKAELVTLHGPWRTRRQLEIAIVEWIDWYNHRRLHSEIGDIPPVEHEQNWYRQQDLALAAGNP